MKTNHTAELKTLTAIEVPERVMVLPWGTVESTKGSFTVDQRTVDGFKADLAEAAARNVDLHFDYEHASRKKGVKAPAAGWIKGFDFEPGVGIFARVDWTADANAHIAKREYRYVSPVVYFNDDYTVAVGLESATLTNLPSINGMAGLFTEFGMEKFESARWFLNLEATATQETIMTEFEKFLAQLRELAGSHKDATQAVVFKALQDKLAAGDPRVAAACKALELKADATGEEIAAAITARKAPTPTPPNASEYVPVGEFKKAQDQIASLQAEALETKANAFIDGGVKAGKIVEATRGMWTRAFKSDPVQAGKDLESAPPIAAPDGRLIQPESPGTRTGNSIADSGDFDDSRMSAFKKIEAHAKSKGISFSKACEELGIA